ncbi:MAG: sigma-70 family RNA polymerase sigma factor [Spirosoma sp.]|nr:sigma-70 family RNA polymerase sigma factor [Spirosoma sp.]
MRTFSDHELVAHYVATSHDQYFAQLYTRHRQLVYQKCLFYAGNTDDADDFVQEIFVRLTHKLKGFKGEAKFTTWLHTVTVNYCIDQLRKRQQKQAKWRMYMLDSQYVGEHSTTADESHFRVFERVLRQLPTHQRDLLLAKYEDDTQIKDLANQKDLTSSAVKMRIKRARDHARNLYDRIRAEEEC